MFLLSNLLGYFNQIHHLFIPCKYLLVKEKADILEQVESLTSVKDELTTQLQTLTSELEKEKSKVHSLQNELTKYKVSACSFNYRCEFAIHLL